MWCNTHNTATSRSSFSHTRLTRSIFISCYSSSLSLCLSLSLSPSRSPQCRYDLIKYSAVVPLEELDEDKMAGLSRALGTPAAVRPFHSHGSSDGKAAAVPPDDLESLAAGALRLLYEVYAEDTRQDTLGWMYARDWVVDVGLVSDIIRMAPPAPHSS